MKKLKFTVATLLQGVNAAGRRLPMDLPGSSGLSIG
jgi:hypothetical protein